ncbi:MFS transporter [Acinetobacter sp. CFCC 10889]|uniref:MFS transporter n=1 Tax=Acinetobacter sp. CFCC 10889 TaxID=1775557 RepID=UPI000DD0EB75|nr:MFS transporter [Acinetobacter sp. CFCC 10889]
MQQTSQHSTAQNMLKKAWLVTALLMVFQMINFADKAVLGLVAESAMAELGMTSTEFGFIGSSFFFLFAISGVIVGFVAGKIQTKWIILVMGVSWAILQFPMLFGGGAMALLITRVILGAAEGPASSISLQHVQGWFEPTARGFPSSMVAAGTTIGPIIAAPVLAYIIAHPQMGWRWAFGFLGIVGLLWTVVWFFVCKEGPYSHIGDMAEQKPVQKQDILSAETHSIAAVVDQLQPVAYFKIFSSKMFIVAVLTGIGCFWPLGFLTTWSPKYIATIAPLSPQMIGTLSTLPWILGAVALMFAGYISRLLMKKGCTVHQALGMNFGMIILVSGISFLLLPHSQASMAILMITIAAGAAMTFPLATMTVGYSVCSKQRAAVMATLVSLSSIGGIVSPLMVGHLMDRAGYIQPHKGEVLTEQMAANLIHGMNQSFTYIGIYLVIVAILAILFLNPDKTAKRLNFP